MFTDIGVYLTKIGLSMLLGIFLGYEREEQNKPAGFRDVALICLGATIFAIIALELVKISASYQGVVRYDVGRIIAYTIVSMGFLGSGVILQHKRKLEGITTASLLWAMVSVGLLCGLGKYLLAIISAISIYFILKLKHVQIKFENSRRKRCPKRKVK